MSWSCFGQLKAFGAEEILKKEYGNLLTTPQAGYDVTITIDIEKPPANKDELIKKISLLKRNVFAAPFHKAIDAQAKGSTTDLMTIQYRQEETIYVKAEKDRVTTIFSTTFKDDNDVIYGKVFLQEFVDARRKPGLQNSPQVLYYPKDPPEELNGVPNVRTGDNIGYVTFVMFPSHYKGDKELSISRIQTFRDYLHYHIKCSKAYMHSRMRARVASLLKILNRAKPEPPVSRNKTVSGKTFRKV